MNIADLNAIKAKMQAKMATREASGDEDTRIVVGMATCGIAAGARPVLNAFVEEVTKRGLKNVKVTQTGCLGMCKLEPMVQVYVPNKPTVTYVHVTAEVAQKIVAEHIVNGHPVKEHTIKE